MRRLLTLPVLTLLLTGALTVALAGPASAAPIAYNTKTQFLTNAPVDSMPTSCVQRRVYLAAATYEWGAFYSGLYRELRQIPLAAGNYTWTNCLDPKNDYYRNTGTLDPDAAGLPTAVINHDIDIASATTWQWGGYLAPPF